MYASVRRYEGVTDCPEAGRRTAEGFVPLIKDVLGLVPYHFADAGGDVMISMSVFEDQSGAEESNKREGEWDAGDLAELMCNHPEITAGEVSRRRVETRNRARPPSGSALRSSSSIKP